MPGARRVDLLYPPVEGWGPHTLPLMQLVQRHLIQNPQRSASEKSQPGGLAVGPVLAKLDPSGHCVYPAQITEVVTDGHPAA